MRCAALIAPYEMHCIQGGITFRLAAPAVAIIAYNTDNGASPQTCPIMEEPMLKQPEPNDPEFSLASQIAPENPSQDEVKLSAARKQTAKASAGAGEPQVISYRHADKRKNNPQVGLVNEGTDPGQPQTTWRYDPHIDPALAFDPGRAQIETLIDNALASGSEAAMRGALEELRRMQSPYLNWTGKASPAVQPDLFNAPFENLPLRDALDFYKHEHGWANRLVAGDSLLVMNSLLQKESMAGRVQMIYTTRPTVSELDGKHCIHHAIDRQAWRGHAVNFSASHVWHITMPFRGRYPFHCPMICTAFRGA